jgi:hypothetical protein
MEISEQICQICLDPLDIKHSLPCFHSFCYFCITRHLRHKNFCPVCFSTPVTKFDLQTDLIKIHNLAIPSALLSRTVPNMRKTLKKYKINCEGHFNLISNRFFDLIEILHKEQFKPKMMNDTEIAWVVNRDSIVRTKKPILRKEVILSLLQLKFKIKKS